MKHLALTAALCLTPVTALADSWCDELWFTRNLIFDRAGYCFGSLLGQVTFDNDDCTTKSPKLSADDKRRVALMKEREKWGACKVDTSRMRHDFFNAEAMREVDTLPVRDDTESGCNGYLGAPITVYAGTSANARVLGQIKRGDSLGNSHIQSDEGWTFVEYWVQGDDAGRVGWISDTHDWFNNCEMPAG